MGDGEPGRPARQRRRRDLTGNANVSPSVACQSGAASVMPRLIPASIQSSRRGNGCQMKPRRAELLARSCSTLSPFTSPTRRKPGTTASSPIPPRGEQPSVHAVHAAPRVQMVREGPGAVRLRFPCPRSPLRLRPERSTARASPPPPRRSAPPCPEAPLLSAPPFVSLHL